jgi:hypothetical protein
VTKSALESFNSQRVATQFALFGKPIKLDSIEGSGCYTAPRRTDQLDTEGGGYKVVITSTLRLRKIDWPSFTTVADFFQKEVQLNLGGTSWQRFRIADQGVMDIQQGGEWKLELEALT